VLCFAKVFQVFYRLVVSDDCTSESCPTMSAGHQYEYRWRDVETGDVISVGASSYMHFLFDWAESVSENQNTMSNNVVALCSDMARRLFRAYAHVFHEHYTHICSLGVSAEFDARLIHLSHFLLKHKMITGKELLPMRLFFSGKVKNSCAFADVQNQS
jgi:MOB kinase activator 1